MLTCTFYILALTSHISVLSCCVSKSCTIIEVLELPTSLSGLQSFSPNSLVNVKLFQTSTFLYFPILVWLCISKCMVRNLCIRVATIRCIDVSIYFLLCIICIMIQRYIVQYMVKFKYWCMFFNCENKFHFFNLKSNHKSNNLIKTNRDISI